MIEFNVDGEPAPQGSKKAFVVTRKDGSHGAVVVDDNKAALKSWRDVVKLAASIYAGEHGKHVPLRVDVVFRLKRGKTVKRLYPTTKPDLDKLTRSIGDSMTDAELYADDSQIVVATQYKRYALPHETPGARIRVSRIEEGETP